MFRYLRAAFFVTEKVPLIGALPVNVMAVLAFVALGFGHPAFWLIGLVGEIAFLWALVGSRRFRKWVDAGELARTSKTEQQVEAEALAALDDNRANRYRELKRTLSMIKQNRKKGASSQSVTLNDLDSYHDLLQVFLRRLQTQERLTSPHRKEDLQSIRTRTDALAKELDENTDLSSSARESRTHTLEILRKRIAVYEKRKETLDEIRSDLEQIEEQFQLALESSEIGGDFDSTRFDLNLARSMITTPSYIAFADDSIDEPLEDEAVYE